MCRCRERARRWRTRRSWRWRTRLTRRARWSWALAQQRAHRRRLRRPVVGLGLSVLLPAVLRLRAVLPALSLSVPGGGRPFGVRRAGAGALGGCARYRLLVLLQRVASLLSAGKPVLRAVAARP